MATPNRAAQLKKILRVLRKQYQPHVPSKDRSLLDHLLFACLLENSPPDAAERAYSTIERDYYDLNEVRVSSNRELAESFRGLTDPSQAADRLKRTLHSVFESYYSFDAEQLKKQNIGQAVKTLEKYDGTTPFVVAYVTQNALGGHAIPVNEGLLIALEVLGVVSEAEAKKRTAPGLERAIPKSKGVETSSLLHQLGVEVGRSPYGGSTKKLLLEIDPACKPNLPKRPPKPEPVEEKTEKKKAKEKTKPAAASKAKPTKKVAKSKTSVKKKAASKEKPAKKSAKPTKKTAKKKAKTKKKTSSRRLSRKKPR